MSFATHTKIRLHSLPPGLPLPFDLYVMINDHFVHYLRAGQSLEGGKISKLDSKAPQSFYILNEARTIFQSCVRDALKGGTLDTRQKAMLLRESTMVLVEELFERPDIETALSDARQVIEDCMEFMESDPDAMVNLLGLSSHDFYTYNHSLDVGIYSLGLGQALGFRGDELKELGLGGLFHDVGKRFVSLEIICKTGALTDEEWAEMQRHPVYGLQILAEHQIPDSVKACAFEHHESMLGNGYPRKLTAKEIHPMARVVAVADTYDALTTKRSYNDPMRPRDAIALISGKLATKFDPAVLKALHHIFEGMNTGR